MIHIIQALTIVEIKLDNIYTMIKSMIINSVILYRDGTIIKMFNITKKIVYQQP